MLKTVHYINLLFLMYVISSPVIVKFRWKKSCFSFLPEDLIIKSYNEIKN